MLVELSVFLFVLFCLARLGWLATHTNWTEKLWCPISYSSNIENVHILQIVFFSHLKNEKLVFEVQMCQMCWVVHVDVDARRCIVVVGLHFSPFETSIPKHYITSCGVFLLRCLKLKKWLFFKMCQSIWCCVFLGVNNKKGIHIDVFFEFSCNPFHGNFCVSLYFWIADEPRTFLHSLRFFGSCMSIFSI